jgi:hypothetical protein
MARFDLANAKRNLARERAVVGDGVSAAPHVVKTLNEAQRAHDASFFLRAPAGRTGGAIPNLRLPEKAKDGGEIG